MSSRRASTPAVRAARRRKSRRRTRPPDQAAFAIRQVESLRQELERTAGRRGGAARWNAEPEDVRRSVAKLVLTLVEFIRQLLERQALRRMDDGTLTPDEIERMGLALMRLEGTVRDIARTFGLSTDDLNLDLGPVGKLI